MEIDLSPASIRNARVAAGLTQVELAHSLGCTPATVASWEHNRRRPQGLYRRALVKWMRRQAKHTGG